MNTFIDLGMHLQDAMCIRISGNPYKTVMNKICYLVQLQIKQQIVTAPPQDFFLIQSSKK